MVWTAPARPFVGTAAADAALLASGAPGRTRTADAGLRTASLYPLSYGGAESDRTARAGAGRAGGCRLGTRTRPGSGVAHGRGTPRRLDPARARHDRDTRPELAARSHRRIGCDGRPASCSPARALARRSLPSLRRDRGPAPRPAGRARAGGPAGPRGRAPADRVRPRGRTRALRADPGPRDGRRAPAARDAARPDPSLARRPPRRRPIGQAGVAG